MPGRRHEMTRIPSHDILFEPVRVGPKILRNRFYAVPHCTGFGSEKPSSQARFRAVKAEGGWAAVCTEYSPVSADSDESPYVSARLWDEDDQRNLARLCDEAHAFDALAGIELVHTGVHADGRESRWPLVAPSQLGSSYEPSRVPKTMEKRDVRRVQSDWVRSATLARSAGFDIIYVYGGHSYLPLQFLSPFYNHRTDEYGGSFANRARFWLETLECVRAAVGDECAIAVRFSVDAAGAAGVAWRRAWLGETGGRFGRPLGRRCGAHWGASPYRFGRVAFFPEGYQIEWTGRVREATSKPIVGVSRLTNPDRMAEIVSSGAWDLIGAARPSISDPSAEEDRRGAARRHPRVHRLQCLLRPVGLRVAPRLHAERDRGRGVPPRLAPGEIREGRERRQRRPHRRRRTGRNGVRGVLGGAVCAASTSWTRKTTWAGSCAGSRSCRGSASGPAWSTTARSRSTS